MRPSLPPLVLAALQDPLRFNGICLIVVWRQVPEQAVKPEALDAHPRAKYQGSTGVCTRMPAVEKNNRRKADHPVTGVCVGGGDGGDGSGEGGPVVVAVAVAVVVAVAAVVASVVSVVGVVGVVVLHGGKDGNSNTSW